MGSLTRSERREQRRGWLTSLCGSGLVHAFVVAVLVGVRPELPRPGPGSLFDAFVAPDDAGGGGGGEPVHMIALAYRDPPASAARPELPPPPGDHHSPPCLPGRGRLGTRGSCPSRAACGRHGCGHRCRRVGLGRRGGGAVAGGAPERGSASAPGTGAGAGGGGVRPPAPITIMMPPPATDAVRGRGAKVLLQVDTMGNVEDVHVVVSSGDSRMDEALRRLARSWRFRPARDAANRTVPYPFEVSVTF